MSTRKPLFEHDQEVYDVVERIVAVTDATVEYGNKIAELKYTTKSGLLIEVVVTDYTDEELDAMDSPLTTMSDSAVVITVYRNEQFVGEFNGAFISWVIQLLGNFE